MVVVFFCLVFAGRFHGVNAVPRRRHSLFLLSNAVLKISRISFFLVFCFLLYFSFICFLPFFWSLLQLISFS